ncbi:MAG: hypothetical protein AAFY25_10200, partial [Pseudomonadota bacterium]
TTQTCGNCYQQSKLTRAAAAVVVDKDITESRDSDGDRTFTYWLTMEFVTQRREEIEVRTSVGSGFYRDVEISDEIPIQYLETEPDLIEVEEGSYATGATVLRWMALVIGCAWLGALWLSGRWTVEALRARRYGKVETAKVVNVVKTAIKVNGGPRFRIVWMDAQGREGRSLLKKAREVQGWHGSDDIRIYQGLKRSWWAGDIGDRAER